MEVEKFNYVLPEELIAQYPLEPRDTSRLLVLDKHTGNIIHKEMFRQIVDEITPNDVLVFNDTKVIPARLHGRRAETGEG